jgi:predicted HicB family RNase H-like nuclease
MTPKRRLEVVMQIRISPELNDLLRLDAEAVGVSVSTWIRMVLIQSYREKLGVQGRPQQKEPA